MNENLNTGALLFHWAEYAPSDGGSHIALGLSPVLGTHDTLLCHQPHGDNSIWQTQLATPTAGQSSVSFSGAMFNNGSSISLEATSRCPRFILMKSTTNRSRFGFVYSSNSQSLLSPDPQRPIPIMLRTAVSDTSMPADYAHR